MKRMILLLGLCCFGFIVQAQEFFIHPLRGYGDTTTIIAILKQEIRENQETCRRYLDAVYAWNKQLPQYEKSREKWLKQIKNKVLTRELKYNLKDTSILADKRFWIYVYFDKKGEVFTVTFEIEEHIYNLLPEKWVRETFNLLMKEKIDITEFWDLSSLKPNAIAGIHFSVRDFFFGRIREQKQLKTYSMRDPGD